MDGETTQPEAKHTILVTGATGFIGSALVGALRARGCDVIAASRHPPSLHTSSARNAAEPALPWRTCDLLRPETLPSALAGVDVAYYLVHSMGGGRSDFRDRELRSAEAFAAAAASEGVSRIVYLGGPKPGGRISEHLRSRLAVGEALRRGPVVTVELRASMIIGPGGASWQIVRDLAMRLPLMVLPKWLRSRLRPVARTDVVCALLAAGSLPFRASAWFDIPGPEILSGRQILERIAALHGRRIVALEIPFLTPRLSAQWLKLVTGADFALARELVLGLGEDLLPEDDRFWQLAGHPDLMSFDDAARLTLETEGPPRSWVARLEERLVDRAPRYPRPRRT